MLVPYRKNQQKIALGLLGFHENLKEHQSLLKELHTYESSPEYELYCYYHEGSNNIQGILGVELTNPITVHDISLNPSYRGEKVGFQMLDELQNLYPNDAIQGTPATNRYLEKWRESTTEGHV